MKAKILFEDEFRILAPLVAGSAPAEDFVLSGDANYEASRLGLLAMLQAVASGGLDSVPSKWFHEASKADKVYEFIKGDLRLFFFKGAGRDIAVCTGGVVKKGRKADLSAVASAAAYRAQYWAAVKSKTLEVM